MDKQVAIIGGGPAGLMAAEMLAAKGVAVHLFEKMPSPARKFLMAGRGGLNLTHSEPMQAFLARYGRAADFMAKPLQDFSPSDLRAWCEALQQPTFIGTSGRIFPKALKASPLLRAWLNRLKNLGVTFHMRRTWEGWDANGALIFEAPGKKAETFKPDAVLLALGGASWPRLGADGGWMPILEKQNIGVEKFKPANCGFAVRWSAIFRQRFEGWPLKPVALMFNDQRVQGEAMITANGIEGGMVYALSSLLRDAIEKTGAATLHLDLAPDSSEETLHARLIKVPRGRQTLSSWLRKAAGLSPPAIGLIHEAHIHAPVQDSAEALARRIKHLPLTLSAPFPLARAISSAGGVALNALDENLMLRAKPGVFAAGEMLDWEAPTGGYLLQGCFSTAVSAAQGVLDFLNHKNN
jgi:uncharacterized flavoprotein (TIGR03862 family)